MAYEEDIAKKCLDSGVIRFNTEEPFDWFSKFKKPIEYDCSPLITSPDMRLMLADEFREKIASEKIGYDVIAGTPNYGVSPATTLADYLGKPLIYLNAKGYDKKKKIEGIVNQSDLDGKNILLIEDLVSTGSGSTNAVKSVRGSGGQCDYCLSVFDYGLKIARNDFENLTPECQAIPLVTYGAVLNVAKKEGYIDENQMSSLLEWRDNPIDWGRNHGFF